MAKVFVVRPALRVKTDLDKVGTIMKVLPNDYAIVLLDTLKFEGAAPDEFPGCGTYHVDRLTFLDTSPSAEGLIRYLTFEPAVHHSSEPPAAQ